MYVHMYIPPYVCVRVLKLHNILCVPTVLKSRHGSFSVGQTRNTRTQFSHSIDSIVPSYRAFRGVYVHMCVCSLFLLIISHKWRSIHIQFTATYNTYVCAMYVRIHILYTFVYLTQHIFRRSIYVPLFKP